MSKLDISRLLGVVGDIAQGAFVVGITIGPFVFYSLDRYKGAPKDERFETLFGTGMTALQCESKRGARFRSERLTGSPWERLRKERFDLDDGVCQYCSKQLDESNYVCDHFIPWRLGGLNHISNLATACWACNDRKRMKMPDVWLVDLAQRGRLGGLTPAMQQRMKPWATWAQERMSKGLPLRPVRFYEMPNYMPRQLRPFVDTQ